MSFRLTCPNCGLRDVSEFSYGGQITRGPSNLPEVQEERWFHRFGCGRWLLVRRDVRTNTVEQVNLLEISRPMACAVADGTRHGPTDAPEGAA